jgi:hypothetical protein
MCESRIVLPPNAGVAELADALDSKSSDRKVVWVRAPPPADRLTDILRERINRVPARTRDFGIRANLSNCLGYVFTVYCLHRLLLV